MTSKKAAATIHDLQCDWERDGEVDEVVNKHRIELIIKQCVDDAVEAVAVKVEEAYLTSPSVTMPPMLRSLARQIRAMKGQKT